MTVFVPESIKVLGSDAGGASVVLCDMFVDALADLPAPDEYNGYKLSMGCTATVINDNSRHRINSAGQWVQITAGTATYTKAEIDSMIARIDATEAEDRAALIALANNGAKNMFNIQNPSTTRSTTYTATSEGGVELSCTNATWTRYVIADIPVASGRDYAFTLYVDDISGTDAFRVYIRDPDTSGDILYDSGNISKAKVITSTITPNTDKIWAGIYLNNSATPKTAYAKIRSMICTAADYTISPAFVPYAPTNRQLYELIKQYHP